jgi:hypothetical protein
MRIVFVVTFALVLAVPALAQDKPNPRREWQDGTWGDTERVSQYVGSVANSTATTTGTTTSAYGSAIPINRVSQLFMIETSDRWYVASQRLKWRWSKPVPMTVNAPSRFAVDLTCPQ